MPGKVGRPRKKTNGAKPEVNEELQGAAQSAAAFDVAKEIDAILADSDNFDGLGYGSVPIEGKLGVLQRMVTAVMTDREYRQILLLAAFDNKQEALLAADAISERQRYGVSIQPILDRVIAQCAVKGDRITKVLSAMSQHVLTTQWNNSGKSNNSSGDRQALSS